MDNLTFIFDTVMLKDENNDYYAINLNYDLWKNRYLKSFSSIIVSTRVKNVSNSEINQKKGYTISNGNNVKMMPITEYNKVTDIILHKKKILRQLQEVINSADNIIIRLPSPLGNLACNVCRKQNKKYAIEMVACPWDGYRYHSHWAGKIIAPFMYFATKKQCKKAKRVLYVTEYFLQHRYPTRGITTNASNVMIDLPKKEILNNRLKKIQEQKGDFVLGLVGPLDLKSKGHYVALKAMEILIKKHPTIKIEFLGLGEGTKIKKFINNNIIKNNVIFKGTLPSGNPVLEWMDSIDILVVPSYQEGLPRALIEAMSRGCPAVGAKTGGIPELINLQVIHKKGNYKKLANDIEKIIKNKEFASNLAIENFENSKKYAKQNLDKKRTAFWNDFKNKEF